MTDSIPDFQKMTTEERVALAAQLREQAIQLETQAVDAQKKLESAIAEGAKAQAEAARSRAEAERARTEVDALFDKSYYLRRMAHAVEMYSPPPQP